MRNLKRALSLALASIMVLGMMVVGAGAVSIDDFTDSEKIVNKEAVTVLTQLNVLNGKGDNSYDPEGIITRAEMAKIICVVLNGGKDPQLGTVATYTYADTVGNWAAGYIEYCTKLGIIAGDGKGNFNPSNTVTGSEAAKMLLAAIGYQPSIEGFVGANWAVATNVQANKIGLYDGLTINPDDGLTRDSAAQMMFNALSANVVTYKYTLTTDGSTVSSIPELVETNSAGNKVTVLQDKFKASKVEAVVVSNEHAALNNSYNSADDEGETTLDVISIDGSKTNARTGTYKVSTDKDLLGENVMVYIKYKNTAGYDEDEAIVIGQPIITSKNRIGTSNNGDKVADVADDNNLELTSETKYYVNYAGYYGGTIYGGDPSEAAAAVADKDNDLTSMTQAQFDVAAKSIGVTVKLIDNDNDKEVDYALAEKYSYGTVNKYETTDKGALRIQGLFNEDEYKSADVVGFDDVAKDDLVLFAEFGGKLYVQKPETVEAKLDNYSTSKKNVTLDGETVKWSGLAGRVPSEIIWVGDYVTSEGVLNTTATFYKDNNGYIFSVGETDESLLTYAVLLGYQNQTRANAGNNLGTKAEAKLLLADGTVDTYTIATIGGKAVSNCTDKDNKGAGVGFDATDIGSIYSYSLTTGGSVRLVKKTDVKFASDNTDNSKGTVKFTSGTSNISYTDTAATPKTGSATVTERTIFLYQKADGTFSRFVGRNAPSLLNGSGAYELTGDPAAGTAESLSVRVSRSGEALVVYLDNMTPTAEWKDNWAFVYNTKVAQNGDAYLVSAIIDGVDNTYLVEQAYDDTDNDGLYDDEVILPDVQSGVYKHTMPYGIYNYSKDGDTYTLTKEHLGTYDVTGIVSASRSSYIRVNSSQSFTVNNDTLMFEARKNKTVQPITSVNVGDQVTVVYNDDNEAMYVFVTEFSYNIVDSGAAITTVAATAYSVDTTGGTAADVTTNAVSPDNRTYQWYKADGTALVEGVDFTGTKTSTLVAKNGIADGTYRVYCTVTNKDANGVASSKDSNTVPVVVSVYSDLVLSWANAGDFTVYADDSSTALTETTTRAGKGVVIPKDTDNITIKNKTPWTADSLVVFNGKDYTVDGDACITLPIADVKALSSKTIAAGNFTEHKVYTLTMPAGVSATWTVSNSTGSIAAGGNGKVPETATVTVDGLDGTYYVKTGAASYIKNDGDITMSGAPLDLSKKYVQVTTVNVVDSAVLGWPQTAAPADVKVTAAVAANTYVEIGGAAFNVTLGLTDTISSGVANAIKGQFSCDDATITGTGVDTATDVIAANGTTLVAGLSPVALSVENSDAADITIILTLTGGTAP